VGKAQFEERKRFKELDYYSPNPNYHFELEIHEHEEKKDGKDGLYEGQ